MLRIYLESGKPWTFACAVDWPGWCRRGKGEEDAIDTLLGYKARYAAAIGKRVTVGDVEVVGRVPGTTTTNVGAPDVKGPWDDEPMDKRELKRQVDIMRAAWTTFDDVVGAAPATLRKGPRGGGRDRDEIVEHVREAERAYGRKLGPRVPPRTPWPEQRDAIVAALLDADDDAEAQWPKRYLVRRIVWHVLDHAWEIEDKSE